MCGAVGKRGDGLGQSRQQARAGDRDRAGGKSRQRQQVYDRGDRVGVPGRDTLDTRVSQSVLQPHSYYHCQAQHIHQS